MSRKPPTLVMAGLFVATAVLGIVLWPVRTDRLATTPQVDEAWTVERPIGRRADVDRQAVTALRLWGLSPSAPGAPAPSEESLTAPDWRVSGIYFSAGAGWAIVSTAGRPDRHLTAGDVLPGGARIRTISTTRICVVLYGKTLSLGLYRE